MKSKYLLLLSISGFLVCIDQLVKILVHTRMQLHESITVLENFFHITYVRNYAAAFGVLGNTHPEFRTIFFLVMPPLALGIIFYVYKNTHDQDKLSLVALASVFGGALGNYIDRVRYGYVIDFLDLHWYRDYTYPAFNIADSAIVCGVITLIILELVNGKKKAKTAEDSTVANNS